MIDWLEAGTLRLPRRAGLHLCSRRDPVAEASAWADKIRAQGFHLENEKTLAIVGGGAGFHVAALAEAFPTVKLLVVDPEEALQRNFYETYPALASRVRWIDANDTAIAREFGGAFASARVLCFRASWQGLPDFFFHAYRKILDHQWKTLNGGRDEIPRILRSVVKCG